MCVVAANVGRSLGHTNVARSRVPVSGLGLVLSFSSGLFTAACQWTLGSGVAWVSVSFHFHGALSNRTIVLIWVVCVFSYVFQTVLLSCLFVSLREISVGWMMIWWARFLFFFLIWTRCGITAAKA